MSIGVVMLPVAVRLVVVTPDKASISPVDVIFDITFNTSVLIYPVAASTGVVMLSVAVMEGVVMLLYSNTVGIPAS